MMFMGTLFDSNQTSSIPINNPSAGCQSDSLSPALPPQTPPCLATQAQCDLAKAEAELRQIQESDAIETETVNRDVERAILGARREERHLLERVEQDHRDTQQRLEQVQRENMIAAWICQSQLDQRLCKLAQLQQQIQGVGLSVLNVSGPNHNHLLREIAEFIQPWEISVSLKKVNFKPSSQPNVVTFGDIHVQEQSLCVNVGSCGPHRQPCALNSQEIKFEDKPSKF